MRYEWIALFLFFLWMAHKDYQLYKLKKQVAGLKLNQAKHFERSLERDSEIITSIFIADWPEHKTPESVRQAFDNIVAEQTPSQDLTE
tara:strand:+ start:1793 stop:2056 length:264 start_codon:yes stop_codon:yes gene_type:complete